MTKDEWRILWWTLLSTTGIFMLTLSFLVARFFSTDLSRLQSLDQGIAKFSVVLDEIQEAQTEQYSLVYSSAVYYSYSSDDLGVTAQEIQIVLAKKRVGG